MNSVCEHLWNLAAQYGGGSGPGGVGPGSGMMGWNSWGFPFGSILLIVIVVVVLLALLPTLRGRDAGTRSTPDESPLDILKKRYARGEISKEEFDRMKEDLR